MRLFLLGLGFLLGVLASIGALHLVDYLDQRWHMGGQWRW